MTVRPSRIVTLLTDFEEKDWYVSVMKGVILQRHPSCALVDITHEIRPGDIWSAAFILAQSYPYFPRGTVHLAVVDPGVGSSRRPVVAEVADQWFVGPDNGLFGLVLQDQHRVSVHHIQNERVFLRPLSSTFHGRDIFAPAAAYIASGRNPGNLGPEVQDWVSLPLSTPCVKNGEILGEIQYVDRFGNGITNIRSKDLLEEFPAPIECEVVVDETLIGKIFKTYSDVPEGQPLAFIGSSGLVEISVHRGNAREILDLKAGRTQVSVKRKGKN